MTAAEQRYRYEEQYSPRGYGFEVRQTISRRERKEREMSAKDRARILMLIFAAGLVCLFIIVVTAYGASINYTNNQLRESNKALRSEVDTLEVQLQSANNIAEIQEQAMNDLGMIYAEGSAYVDLTEAKDAPEDLAVVLKDNAYE